ncbi:MAG TPA: hypothetical protein VFQ85_13910 [Mycobacteriales bacterium]|jgi:hypothetical protein|nr:hypothetical protein [Mycobacteriales bacterium]
MTRCRALLITSCTLAASLVAGAAAAGGPPPAPTGRAAGLAKPERADDRSKRLRAALGARWSASPDVVTYGFGDANGYHVTAARQREGFAWRAVATIQPDGYAEDEWSGHSCLTGDGRYVVAVVAPRHFANRPALRDRGASAYVVSLANGSVRLVASGVAMKYHTPGCGTGSDAVVLRHLGVDQEATELLTVDAAHARVTATTLVTGQVTSAVPTRHGVVGAMGPNVVRLAGDGPPVRAARTPGTPFSLRPNASGGVDYLVADGATTRVFATAGAARAATALGTGRLDRVALFLGRGGRNVVAGLPAGSPAGALRRVAGDVPVALLAGASLDGHVTLAHPDKAADRARLAGAASDPDHPGATAPGADVRMLAASDGKPLPNALATLPAGHVTPAFRSPALPAAPVGGRLGTSVAGPLGVTGNSTTPTCAVPRNHLQRQVPQPTAARLDWAAEAAVRGLLTAANGNGRPANYLNMGLAAYAPNTDFTIPALSGAAAGQGIPRLVVEGIMAQENAYRHASRRALPGLAGNPAISDYYGSDGGLDTIDYDQADCGYGAMQVTTGMRASDTTPYSANGKTKIAVDYAENVVAGSKILAGFWNQLYAQGITLNGGDPRYLENWYLALWAYNTGLQPNAKNGNTTGCSPSSTCTDGYGNWGLGWTNNPRNADYEPTRQLFLRATYADAETPGDWPYQERVLGWMETPILDYKGSPSYTGPSYPAGRSVLNMPSYDAFCTLADDHCSPTYQSPYGDALDYCTLDVQGPVYRHCWWHTAVTYASCATECAVASFTYASTDHEPGMTNPHPPACDSDRPATAVLVDDQPEPDYNVVGCGTRNWSSNGTFSLTWGSDATGVPVGQIDLHQLGAGLGGHTWFAKNRTASDTAHRVTGTWTPPSTMAPGLYVIAAHVPEAGASTASARYLITQADGTFVERVVDQHLHQNVWVGLGAATLGPGSKVTLSNATDDPNPGVHDVAFDGMAFVAVSGTVVEKQIDVVSIFSENQDLDANDPWWMPSPDTPFTSRQKLYDWAVKYSSGLLAPGGYSGGISYPPCGALTGQNARCIGPKTRDAFQAWFNDVQAAGTSPTAHPPGKSIPRWLAFANDVPTASIVTRGPNATLSDDESYKIRTRIKASYVVSGVSVVPGSVSQSVEQRTGDTALPAFMKDVFAAYEADYGIRRPNLDYDNYDLNVYTHEATHVNANSTREFPGRAYRDHTSAPKLTDNGTCVALKTIGGGVIGYRPMLGAEVVSAEVDRWRDDANAAVDAGRAPAVVGDFASEIFNGFYKTGIAGALWNHAGPIWNQTSLRLCGTGEVRPDPDLHTIVQASYMPDVYVYVDGQLTGQDGKPATGPVTRGDFRNFTNNPAAAPNGNAFGLCDIGGRDRGGNPWSIALLDSVDTRPDHAVYCDHDTFWDPGEPG